MTDKDDTAARDTGQGHTPGLWYFDGQCVRAFNRGAGSKHQETDKFVASVCNILDGPMIAAAPDMLEALRGIERVLLRFMDDPSRADDIPEVVAARQARANATVKRMARVARGEET